MWQISLGFFFVFVVAQTIAKRYVARSSENVPDIIPPLISYVVGTMPLGIIASLFASRHIEWNMRTVALLALEGTFIALYNVFSFRALKHLPAALFLTLFQVSSVIIILLGWLLLDETLEPSQLLGAAILLVSAVLAIWAPMRSAKNSQQSSSYAKSGLLFAFLSAITIAIGLIAEKATLQYVDLGAYFIFGFASQTIALTVFALPQLRRYPIAKIPRRVFVQSVIFGAVGTCMGFSYLIALDTSDNISLITALKALALPLTAIVGHLVLKERDNNTLLFAAIALGVVGVIVTAL